ncbi:cytochrome c oxidase assembly protein subunit 15 [Hasllibacter halocynthiae]|uniref:Heme A synthase n=1 Tax=Hasllibacter halocynthiae TaxID=595589 RepID=A0A2T0X8C6_9RHOB|nr:heme A synthase [Hasllibacter halocynthiae]PRY95200.1 cytochrome c oxidase assembly protein subunit 15 [Hasllibacter halocynthiae]
MARSIFEEVGTDPAERRAAPAPGVIDRPQGARRGVRLWLWVLFGLVVVMIAVGGMTRLTDSGLSITEWAPLSGAIPPLSAADWQREFDAYRRIPEYQLQNRGMSLSEFQFIYWWEWGHRQLGRVIGLVWAVGFVGFLAARKVPPGWTGRLLLLGALGGLQGFIGWWMVSSGLEGTMLDVASYRLATHLGLAFVILGLIALFAQELSRRPAELIAARRAREGRRVTVASVWIALVAVQILLGALVAGIDAGRNYHDWPLMAGGLTPPGMWSLEPWWRNLFENDGTVQFFHRLSGYVLLAFSIYAWRVGRASPSTAVRAAFIAAFAMVLVQTVIGIVTVRLMSPWYVAIVHQLGAVFLWVLVIRARFLAAHPPAQSVRGAPA